MKTKMLFAMIVALIVGTGLLRADEENAKEPAAPKTKLTGVVKVVANEAGETTGIVLVVEGADKAKTEYAVAMAGKGKKLESMDGEVVNVTGVVTSKDDVSQIKVQSVEVVKAEEEGGDMGGE